MGQKHSSKVSPNVIICEEREVVTTNVQPDYRFTASCCGSNPCQSTPTYFDSTVAKNNVALTNILGGIFDGWGAQEIERKFSEANKKVNRGTFSKTIKRV